VKDANLRVFVPRIRTGQKRIVCTYPIVEHDTFSATEFTLATGFHVQPELIDVQAVTGFGDLDRAVVCLAVKAAEDRAVAITEARAAPAANLRFDNREEPARIRVQAKDNRAADRGEISGG
jgi:hypothetical protein